MKELNMYETNLKYLKEHGTEIYRIMTEEKDIFKYTPEVCPEQFNYRITHLASSCFLHSFYDKEEELDLMFAKIPRDTEVMFLFGLGCGYALNYLRKYFVHLKRLIIIEPCLEVFKGFLQEKNFKLSFFGLGKVSFWFNKDADSLSDYLSTIIYQNLSPKIAFAATLSYTTLFSDYYQAIYKSFASLLRYRRLNLMTFSMIPYILLENIMHNFLVRHQMADSLRDLLKNKPVVIVGAGPSLNKQLHLLPELKKKAVVIAVGSAIKILQRNGLKPHFQVSVDYGKENKDNIMTDLAEAGQDIPLLYANQIYKDILDEYAASKFLMILNIDNISAYIYHKLGITFTEVASGPSVANILFYFLCTTECSKIIFLGQDMCFYDDKLHAEGAVTSKASDILSENLIKTKDIYGQDVVAASNYIVIKRSYEEFLKNNQIKQELINATDGGLGIEGVKNISLQKVLEEYLTDLDNLNMNEFINEEKLLNEKLRQKDKWKELKKEAVELFDFLEMQIKKIKDIHKKENRISKSRVFSDLTYLEKQRQKLKENEFYQNIVFRSLKGYLYELDLYYGQNKDERNIQKIKDKLVNQYAEEEKYVSLFIYYLEKIIEKIEGGI